MGGGQWWPVGWGGQAKGGGLPLPSRHLTCASPKPCPGLPLTQALPDPYFRPPWDLPRCKLRLALLFIQLYKAILSIIIITVCHTADPEAVNFRAGGNGAG